MLSSAFYRAGTDGNWSLGGAVPAAADDSRLETQLVLDAAGSAASEVDVVMYMTDWAGARDYTPASHGRGGRLHISARDIAPAALTRGTGWPMLALMLTATGGAVAVHSLGFTQLGNASGTDVPTVHLFSDGDRDGQFSEGDLLLAGSAGNHSGRIYRCSPLFPVAVPEGKTVVLFAVMTVAAVAAPGATAGLGLAEAVSVSSSAVAVDGSFPMQSSTPRIASGGGRSLAGPAGDDTLSVSYYSRNSEASGPFENGRGAAGGRAPTGGWPANWTTLSNDSDAGGPPDELDINSIAMTDNSNYIYFRIGVEDLSSISANDEWNFYFKTNDDANNNNDMWYRLSIRVTDPSTPQYNSTLYSYTGSSNPPTRGSSWTVNETHVTSGNSTDQTAYGFMLDPANDTILFYVAKSSLFGNLLGPGNSTQAYADTWYIKNNKWKNADRGPNGNNVSTYTMVPEFSDVLLPAAGSVVLFSLFRYRYRRSRPGRAGVRRQGRNAR